MGAWTRDSGLDDKLSGAKGTSALLTAGSPVPREVSETQEALKSTARTQASLSPSPAKVYGRWDPSPGTLQ